MKEMFDGRNLDGRFFVGGLDVTGAPELRGLRRRQVLSLVVTAVVVGLAATWWIGAGMGWAIVFIVACGTIILPVSVTAYALPEILAIHRIERRYRLEGRA